MSATVGGIYTGVSVLSLELKNSEANDENSSVQSNFTTSHGWPLRKRRLNYERSD